MMGLIRYVAEFAFSVFPWVFLVSYMVISISISFIYLTEVKK